MFTQMLNQKIKAAVANNLVDKRVTNDAGVYVASGETREENEGVKIMRERDSMTVTEITAEVEEASFAALWIEKNKDQVFDKSTKNVTAGTAGAPAPAAAGASKPKSLFA